MRSRRGRSWRVAIGVGALVCLALPAGAGAQPLPTAPADETTTSLGKFTIRVNTAFVPVVPSLINNGESPGYYRQPTGAGNPDRERARPTGDGRSTGRQAPADRTVTPEWPAAHRNQ